MASMPSRIFFSGMSSCFASHVLSRIVGFGSSPV